MPLLRGANAPAYYIGVSGNTTDFSYRLIRSLLQFVNRFSAAQNRDGTSISCDKPSVIEINPQVTVNRCQEISRTDSAFDGFLATCVGRSDNLSGLDTSSGKEHRIGMRPVITATGCTVVLKPAEQTPLSALRLGELIQEAGIPDGVVNIVTGLGETAGAALAAHPGVDKVAFTGSTEVGKLIVKAAANDLKKVSLELGGKSPNIIFEDADLETAIPGAASAIFFNHGQCCCAGSRLYVQKKHFDKVVGGVSAAAKKIKLGPGHEPDTEMGPLVSEEQLNRVMGYLEAGGTKAPSRCRRQARGRSRLLCPAHRAREHEAGHESDGGRDLRPGRLRRFHSLIRTRSCNRPTTTSTDSLLPSGRATWLRRTDSRPNLRAGTFG